jgi:hypothetical protein
MSLRFSTFDEIFFKKFYWGGLSMMKFTLGGLGWDGYSLSRTDQNNQIW